MSLGKNVPDASNPRLGGLVMMGWACGVLLLRPPAFADPPSAQPAQAPPASVTEQLEGLGADSYQVRKAATRRLLRDRSLDQQRLERLFKQARSPEQRHRLLTVALHHTIRRIGGQQFDDDRGALGISHRRGQARVNAKPINGARVVDVLPGFPAYAYLQPGDLIVKLDGQALGSRMDGDDFARAIQRRSAGDMLELTFYRKGRRRRSTLTLGSAKALKTMYTRELKMLSFRFARQWRGVKARYETLMPEQTVLEP